MLLFVVMQRAVRLAIASVIGVTGAVALVAAGSPASAQQEPEPRPIGECIIQQADGSFDVLFGWEIPSDQPDGEVTVPLGAQNRAMGGTIVSGPPTFFQKPVGGAATPQHVVWPPFVWNPPDGAERTGRTAWWPAAQLVVNVPAGGTAMWTLAGRTAQLGTGPQSQRCSQHLFVRKLWDGSPVPPPELDKQAYQLLVTMESNPIEPTEFNVGGATCKYLEYATPSSQFAPYGEGFSTTESDQLNCWFQNDLPYTTDIGGFWLPRGSTYAVSEANLPPNWEPSAGVGDDFLIDFEDPDSDATCGLYPAFGSAAARPDSNGAEIPLLGRASNKWCLHLVENQPVTTPTTTTTTTTVGPGGAPSTAPPGPPPTLPATGQSDQSDSIARWAAVLLALGMGALAVSRRSV